MVEARAVVALVDKHAGDLLEAAFIKEISTGKKTNWTLLKKKIDKRLRDAGIDIGR
jgi:hypothetical protein